jgi:hypothetical protein
VREATDVGREATEAGREATAVGRQEVRDMTRGKRPSKKRSTSTRAVKKRAAKRPGKKRAAQARGTGGDVMPLRVPPRSILTGGDLDADQQRAWDSGDEAVGGSVATPDQDVVDDLGRALGVERKPEDEVQTAEEILRERDRHRWKQEE